MAYNSLLVEAFQKSKGKATRFNRVSQRSPVNQGQTRGIMGSTGANAFQGRNPMAGEQKETALMRSPVFQAFVQSFVKKTPVTSFLGRF